MKIRTLMFPLLCSLLLASVPAHADEITDVPEPPAQARQKDECLLVARNCGTAIMSIQDKIERLKEEIAKGRAVYTPEELHSLKQKLDEVSRTLDYLLER